jgi:hypothetical protein
MNYVGLDLGQKIDPSAVVVVERIEHRRAFMGSAFERLVVRYIERMPLGTPYPRVVERVRRIVQSQALRGNCVLAVDASGVGAPVVDMLRAAQLGCSMTAFTITGGERSGGESVTKRDLVAGVQVLLESGRLTIGKVAGQERLVKELSDVRMTVGASGRTRLGADGYGEHDDLAIALALACWKASGAMRRGHVGEQSQRLL